MWIQRHLVRPQPDPVKQRCNPVAVVLSGGDAVDDQRLPHDIARRHARVQRCIGILVDHLHFFPVRQHGVAIQRRNVLPVQVDGSGGRFQKLQQGPPGGGFAAATFADQS